MKFELKTENDNYPKLFLHVLRTVFNISLIIIFFDVALKLGIISKKYQIDYFCKILSVEKSTAIFKKLSKHTNLTSKQRILDFCRVFVK